MSEYYDDETFSVLFVLWNSILIFHTVTTTKNSKSRHHYIELVEQGKFTYKNEKIIIFHKIYVPKVLCFNLSKSTRVDWILQKNEECQKINKSNDKK